MLTHLSSRLASALMALTDGTGAPAAGSPSGPSTGWMLWIWIAAIIGIFYFFMIRPQKKREKERLGMIDSLKKGDRVVTIGGVYGTVVAIKEDSIVLRIDEERDIHVRFTKSAISTVLADEREENRK